uniref:hypothetical protein n=1 Tax=uncultured Draconibacterium sp. TaxID=1573823 RepID=UPI003216640A
MTNNQFRTLINKYAILVFVGYFLTFLVSTIIQRSIPDANTGNPEIIGFLSSSIWIIQLIVNIIAAILVSKDLKRLNIKNNLIVVMTVLFSLIGITMFFITINREMKNTST